MIDDDAFEELPEHVPAWAALDRITTYRKQLLRAGYRPLPVNGKKVQFANWSDLVVTDEVISSWERDWPDHSNTGILTAETPAIDLDIKRPLKRLRRWPRTCSARMRCASAWRLVSRSCECDRSAPRMLRTISETVRWREIKARASALASKWW